MKREQCIELATAISNKELKVKHLSSESYVKLIGLRRPLISFLTQMGEDERTLAEDMGINVIEGDYDISNKDFADKLRAIQAKKFEPKELNFIEFDEFKKWTNEIDVNTGGVLAEFLLK